MAQTGLSTEEIGRRGAEIYESRLRRSVETPENIGKIISIDIETGDYAIDDDLLVAGDRVRERHPDAPMYAARIGYNAVFAVGGSLVLTALLAGNDLAIRYVDGGEVSIVPAA